MKNWKERNYKAFELTFEDGHTTSTAGFDMSVEDAIATTIQTSPNRYKKINGEFILRTTSDVKAREYSESESIQRSINHQLRQIEICQQYIKELEADLQQVKEAV
jgi:hypothetical protein